MNLLRGTTDRLFLRFCRSGDAAALGRVFDRTAPELLRVALYLSGNRADAEDLVQRTFLAAIESRRSYDPTRRAVPWLLGILANHARQLRRERAPRVEAAGENPVPDPARAAADRELADAVARLRAELGEPYRPVLQLHLEEGLNAREIATRLGRPAGTVRTQLVRALRFLRGRLPSGFIAGLLPVMPGVGSLGAVRQAVMSQAHTAAGVTTAAPWGATAPWLTWTLGNLAMKNMKQLLVCSLLLAGALWWVPWGVLPWAHSSEHRPAPVVGGPAGEPPGSRVSAISADLNRDQTPSRAPVAVPEDAPPADGCMVRGRLVFGDSGLPVPRAEVQLKGTSRSGSVTDVDGWIRAQDYRLDVRGETDHDGRFTIRFEPGNVWYSLRIAAADCADRTFSRDYLLSGEVWDLGTVPLAAGAVWRGQIEEASGKPVGETSLRILLPQEGRLPDEHVGAVLWSKNGMLASEHRLRCGTWPIEIEIESFELVAPREISVPEPAPVRILVRRRPPQPVIRGTVVDESGQPTAEAQVRAVPEDRTWRGRTASARTRVDGSFELRAPEGMPTEGLARVSLGTTTLAEPGTVREVTAAWNSAGVRLDVRRAGEVTLRVVDETTGQPCERYVVRCFPTTGVRGGGRMCGPFAARGGRGEPRALGPHPGGRTVLDGIWSGKNVVMVWPLDGRSLVPCPVVFERGEGGATPEVEVKVRRGVPIPVRVVTPSGSAVRDARVELLVGPTALALDAHTFAPHPDFDTGFAYSADHPVAFCSNCAHTDNQGRCVVVADPQFAQHALRVTTRERLVAVQALRSLVPDQEIEVRPGGTASLEITVPAGLLPLRPYLRLDRDHGQKQPDGDGPVLPVDPATGKATLGAVAAGDHVAFLLVRTSDSGPLEHRAMLGPFGPIHVAAGMHSKFTVDATAAGVASLDLRLLLHGRDPATVEIILDGKAGDVTWLVGPLGVAADGSAHIPALLSGDYTWWVRPRNPDAPSLGNEARMAGDGKFTLAPAERARWDLSATWRTRRFRLVHSGAALVRQRLVVHATGPQSRSSGIALETDAAGQVVVAPCPGQRIHFQVLAPSLRSEPIDVDSLPEDGVATVALHAPR